MLIDYFAYTGIHCRTLNRMQEIYKMMKVRKVYK